MGERRVHDRAQNPRREVVPKAVGEVLREFGLVVRVFRPQGGSDNSQILEHNVGELGMLHASSPKKSQHDEATSGRKDVEVVVKVRSTDAADDKVNPGPTRRFQHPIGPAAGLVVERVGRAQFLTSGALLVGPNRYVHGVPVSDRHRRGCRANTAGPRVYQNPARPPLVHQALRIEALETCEKYLRNGGCLHKGHTGRHPQYATLMHRDVLGVAPTRKEGADAIAHAHRSTPATHPLYHACRLQT
mmetsp:Transcript_16573/g.46784  ORF Transcript_16573/g.46784 Transcript_16573/m.46784 type:complete len:245 (-) Transcript_16573:287-1021(-)